MIAIRIVVLLILCVLSSTWETYPIPNYELRRPIQYFYHLMELKSKFNPMMGGINSINQECSSKSGPFCRLAGHEPFQQWQLKKGILSEQGQNTENILMSQRAYMSLQYEQILRNQQEVFMIRNELVTQYDDLLRGIIGDRMHKDPVLPEESFQRTK